MSEPASANGSEPLTASLARGVFSGLAGTVVMTGFQRWVEMPLTGRSESYAPAEFAERLGVRKRRGQARRRVNYATHFLLGAGWGVARVW